MPGLRTNLCLRAITTVLDANGIAYRIERGGKHPRVLFEIEGRRFVRAFPLTPSDRRSPLNAAAETKRLFRGGST